MHRLKYSSPAVWGVDCKLEDSILAASVIRISTEVKGVTVAPWEAVVPEGTDDEDNAFDVSFE